MGIESEDVLPGDAEDIRMRSYCRNGCWLIIVCLGACLFAGCAGQGDGGLLDSFGQDLSDLPGRMLEGSKDTFGRKDNMAALLLAGGASIVMHNTSADDNIQDHVREHRKFRGCGDQTFDVMGNPPTHFAATALWYAISAENHDEFNKDRAWTMMTALSVNAAVTAGLKAVRDNRTPNDKRWAWPSGHTSSSFTVASVLDEFYGPKVGIPSYVLASVVGYRMVDADDHWASDVVFGATLGWVVGHTIARRHKQLEVAGFKVLPYVPNTRTPAMGICLARKF
jgi:hypothetical protein